MMMAWAALWSTLGAIVGAFVGAYWGSRRAESGRIDANILKISEVVKIAFETALAAEAGKRFASHDDIENVLKELKLVTTETEGIKTRIGEELWNKQRRHELKVTAYRDILVGIANAQIAAKNYFQMQCCTPVMGADRDYTDQLELSRQMFTEACDQMFRSASFAVISVHPRAIAILEESTTRLKRFKHTDEIARYLRQMEGALSGIAAADLGTRPDFELPET